MAIIELRPTEIGNRAAIYCRVRDAAKAGDIRGLIDMPTVVIEHDSASSGDMADSNRVSVLLARGADPVATLKDIAHVLQNPRKYISMGPIRDHVAMLESAKVIGFSVSEARQEITLDANTVFVGPSDETAQTMREVAGAVVGSVSEKKSSQTR